MIRHSGICVRLAATAMVLIGLVGLAARSEEPARRAQLIHIGLANSLTRDTPDAIVQIILEPFAALMESQTGVAGQIVLAGDAHALAVHLKAGKFQLAIMQGVEFAWARQECPELKPLMIAINKRPQLQACVVARSDSEAATFDDLRQKTVALPQHGREHCDLFLERCCRESGQDIRHFFGQIVTPRGVEPALDDVVRGKVQAAVVDAVGLESYQRDKPGCFGRLKTIKVSELFPAAVVVHYPGRLEPALLERLKEGMAHANDTPVGRQLLAAVRWSGYEPVPADYDKTLTEIVKTYPPPPAQDFLSASKQILDKTGTPEAKSR